MSHSLKKYMFSRQTAVVEYPAFISTWDTTKSGVSTSSQIALPLISLGTYDFKVYYLGSVIKTITAYTDNVITFPDGSGIKEINCVGTFTGFKFNNDGDKLKIKSVTQFGTDFRLIDGIGTFYGCSNLTSIGTDLDVSGITNMTSMFRNDSVFNSDLSNWEVLSVTHMSFMFYNATAFNSDISNWDVAAVFTMYYMFYNAKAFNIDISLWDFAAVLSLSNFMRAKTSANYSSANYDALLTRWRNNAQDNLSVEMGTIKYSSAATADRTYLTGTKGWTITDGGLI